MDTISPVYGRLILRELQRRDIDASPLFEGTTLDRKSLERGADISMPDFLQILSTGDRLLEAEQLGFLLGRHIQVFALGSLGFALAAAPSLRGGLQLMESYTRLHATYIDIATRSSLTGLTMKVCYQQDIGAAEIFHTQTAMLLLQQYAEMLFGERIEDLHFRLAIPEPENKRDYLRELHGSVSFAANANEIDLPNFCLDTPSPYYHPGLWQQARMELSLRLKEQVTGSPYAEYIVGVLQTTEPPLPEFLEVAANLHVSGRTLNRRLRNEHASFRQLKSQAQVHWARLYLRQTNQSVEAIALALGYTDAANFRRAFRKIEGCSPMEFRNAHSREAGRSDRAVSLN